MDHNNLINPMLAPFMTAERLAMGVDQSVSIELPVILTVSSLLSTTETLRTLSPTEVF